MVADGNMISQHVGASYSKLGFPIHHFKTAHEIEFPLGYVWNNYGSGGFWCGFLRKGAPVTLSVVYDFSISAMRQTK